MKFKAAKSTLVSALGRCLSVTDAKSTMPILASLKLVAGKQLITLGATDLFRGITVKFEADIDQPGTVCLPARELFERIKTLPDGEVAFLVEGTQAVIKAIGSKRRFTMSGAPGEEYPTIPTSTGTDASFQTTTHKLAELIGAVASAISTDTSRPMMNVMLLECAADGSRAVAMDGYRINTVLQGAEPSRGVRWSIPLVAVNDLRKLCDTKAEEELSIHQSGNTVFFRFEDFIFSTALGAGEFPPWQRAVPSDLPRKVIIDRLGFMDALKAVSVSSSDNTGRIRFSFRNGLLSLQAKNAKDGEGFDEVEIEGGTPEGVVCFNYRMMLDAVAVLATDTVELHSGEYNQPAIIRVPGSDVFMALVLPQVD